MKPWQDTEPELKEIDVLHPPFPQPPLHLLPGTVCKKPKSPTIMNIPPDYVAFHALTYEHAYDAAILVKLALAESCHADDRSCQNHVAAVDLSTTHVDLRPFCPGASALFRSDISELLTTSSIVAVDSNAMSKLWNSKITNKKGSEIESLIYNHNLSLLNRPLAQLDFVPAVQAARSSVHRDYRVSPRSMPWWSKELCAMRNRARRAF
ncbi:hypothetical protein OUZ56_010121 [Daphnia magna]|uniref:Endonuclease/exonuclease/phosphatase domain-containing protein n=1 Tax=Daphnia magna TaxID=35525 RepID=A0ABR0AHY4_9CRUS|nr:hypothetical protein OUZ56_010121 [Daphnia magna]